MSEVILVRPGQTDFDEQHRIQGGLDLPLNKRGQQHVAAVIHQLNSLEIDVILCGPGEPARSTAEELARALDVPVKERKELRNLDQGLWQGLQLDEVRRKYPRLLKQWQEHPEAICPPQGEPVAEAMERLRDVLKKPLKKYHRFMVVAADPLASLIAAIVRGCKPDFTGPMCSHTGPCVQRLVPGELPPRSAAKAEAHDHPELHVASPAVANPDILPAATEGVQ